MHKLAPPEVYVQDTGTSKGRGVFARRRFFKDEVVETAPVVIVPIPRKHVHLDRVSILHPKPEVTVEVSFVQEFKVLVFAWGHLAKLPGTSAIALGYGSLYNSANPANLRYEADAANVALRFIAVRDIQADEELTINYNADGGGAQWRDQNWFVRMNIKPEPEAPVASEAQRVVIASIQGPAANALSSSAWKWLRRVGQFALKRRR